MFEMVGIQNVTNHFLKPNSTSIVTLEMDENMKEEWFYTKTTHTHTHPIQVLDQNTLQAQRRLQAITLQALIHVDFITLLASSNHFGANAPYLTHA